MPQRQHHEIAELELLNKANPRSVINLLPENVRNRVLEVVASHSSWFNLDEGELYPRLKADCALPKPTDDILRMKFWLEYERVQAFVLPEMNIAYIVAGVCEREYFVRFYLRSPSRVAWLMCPPINYMARLDEIQNEGLRTLSELMREPHHDEFTGKLNFKMAELKIKIFALTRAKAENTQIQFGGEKQTTIQNNIQLNIKKDSATVIEAIEGSTTEAMERRLKELEALEEKVSLPMYTPPAVPEEILLVNAPGLNMRADDEDV